MSRKATRAFCIAKASTIASPMPLAPPLTTITRSLLAASSGVRHQENPSYGHEDRGSIVPAPDGAFLTSVRYLLVFGRSVSSTAPALPRLASNIARSIPSLLPQLDARSASWPAIANGRGCYQTYAVQTGTRPRLPRPLRPPPAFFYERRF